MNIGFEAKKALRNNTGLGHYSRTLINSLAEYFPEHEYLLFTPKISALYNPSGFDNIQVVTPHRFPFTFLTAAWRSKFVTKDLKRLDIDLYHGLSHEIPVGMPATGIPSVVTMHDLIFERYPQQFSAIDVRIYRKKFTYAAQNATRVIAISKQTKDDLVDMYGISPNKIDICYQSCNPAFGEEVSNEELQRIKQLYHLPNQFFLYVGSVIERKNLLTICKALYALKGRLDIPLVVIGDGGAYKQQVKQYIAGKGMDKQVIFLSEQAGTKDLLSFRSAKDFPAIYQQAVCMIYPSIFEGFGIPVLEAMLSRIPVITTNVSCMPETGGNAAAYVSPFDEQGMADTMYNIYKDETLRLDMVAKGLQHAQNFTQYKCAAAVMDVYLKTVKA
jgi:glycosyltransferase involved in cell wall biosynthesis